MTDTFEHVTCTACGCLCDDLVLEISEGALAGARNACFLSEAEFLPKVEPLGDAAPLVQGAPVELDTAITRAVDVLSKSDAPLIFLAETHSTATYRAACHLADHLGATLDTCPDAHSAAATIALQSAGMSTATLGEVRARSDLVIYWGSDPVTTHPRHLERFVENRGAFMPEGRRGRQVIVIDHQRTPTADIADRFIQIGPDCSFELVWTLRALLKGIDCEAASEIVELAEQMKSCRYGALFFGHRLGSSAVGHGAIEGLLRMVRELNAHTRFVAMPMAAPGDVCGAENVLTWQTGFPLAINFAAGYPRYNPNEYSASSLLENREVDAVVLIGSKSVEQLSTAARDRLQNTPFVAIGTLPKELCKLAAVSIPTAVDGIHMAGSCHRMDGVSLPMQQLAATALPSNEQVLQQIQQAINSAAARSLR